MAVEIEITLFVNVVANFLILRLVGLFCGRKAKFAFLSALLGGAVALVMPIFCISAFANIAIEIFLSLGLCLISFEIKPIKNFLCCYAAFLGITFMFGGGCLALEQSVGSLTIAAAMAVIGVIYVVSAAVIKRSSRQKKLRQFTFKVCLTAGEKTAIEEGYLDSGNILYDPQSHKPIVLITFDVFKKLFGDINYISAYLKQVDISRFNGGHYVKISTVASGTSILVFTLNRLQIFEGQSARDYVDVPVGLSFSGFDKTLGTKVLLHPEFA